MQEAVASLLLIENDRGVILLAVSAGTGSRNCIRLSIRRNGALVRIDHFAILLPGGVNRMGIDPLERKLIDRSRAGHFARLAVERSFVVELDRLPFLIRGINGCFVRLPVAFDANTTAWPDSTA